MCSQGDDPTTYDAPEPQKPRAYVLSGSKRTFADPQPSVALAVIGEMLNDAEHILETSVRGSDVALAFGQRIVALREARERVAAAEAEA